jgi:anti-anti-sigma factor
MAITGKKINGYYLIDVDTNFTTFSLIQIRKEVDMGLESGSNHIVFDLSKCQHMDSSAIGLLGNLYKKFDSKKVKIGLLKPLPPILDLIAVTHISTFVNIYKTEEEISLP